MDAPEVAIRSAAASGADRLFAARRTENPLMHSTNWNRIRTSFRRRHGGLAAVLVATMAAGTIGAPTIGVLGTYIMRDLEMTRTQLGTVIGTVALVGALVSPFAGMFVDATGYRVGVRSVFGLASFALISLATARTLWGGLSFGVLSGLSQSLANPSTNKAIVNSLDHGERALVTGLKQSGVQAGVVTVGILAPVGAVTIGWRDTVVVGAAALAFLSLVRLTRFGQGPPGASEPRTMLPGLPPRGTRTLSAYGALMGLSAGFVSLMPLYASEAADMGVRLAGGVIALAGASAVVGRLAWTILAERSGHFFGLLVRLALGATLGNVVLLGVPRWPILLWCAAVIIGLSASSWTAVGMLAVMSAPPQKAGSAAGWVYLGFLSGVALSGPIVGVIVDHVDSYAPAIGLMIAASTTAAGVAWFGAATNEERTRARV